MTHWKWWLVSAVLTLVILHSGISYKYNYGVEEKYLYPSERRILTTEESTKSIEDVLRGRYKPITERDSEGYPVYTLGPRQTGQKVPPILLMTMLMGNVTKQGDKPGYFEPVPIVRPYIRLTLASMKRNPEVDFALINIVKDPDPITGESAQLLKYVAESGASNVFVHVLTYQQYSQRVADKLGIHITFNDSWGYKQCDFKPTFAYLFLELFERRKQLSGGTRRPHEKHEDYKYWGYADLDLIWGDFKSFAHLFNSDYVIIRSRALWILGIAQFFLNNDWTKKLFFSEPDFVKLLSHHKHYALDEWMGWKESEGLEYASMDSIVIRQINLTNQQNNITMGIHDKDRLYLEEHQSRVWAGPVVWRQGKLLTLHATRAWPAMREILVYHRPGCFFDIYKKFPKAIASEVESDMQRFGYVLPEWVPLATRHICSQTLFPADSNSSWLERIGHFRPYTWSCLVNDIRAHRQRHAQRAVRVDNHKNGSVLPLLMMSVVDDGLLRPERQSLWKLIVHSMQANPTVDFVITVVDNSHNTVHNVTSVDDLHGHQGILSVATNSSDSNRSTRFNITTIASNVMIQHLNILDWKRVVKQRLGMHVRLPRDSGDYRWRERLTDFQAALAYLFPRIADKEKYRYWGYHDIYTIWGDIPSHASLLTSTAIGTNRWIGLQRLTAIDKNATRHHSVIATLRSQRKTKTATTYADWNNSISVVRTRVLDANAARRSATPVLWNEGKLIVLRSHQLPALSELLAVTSLDPHYFHPPSQIATHIEEDMIRFGYLLPDWIPLTSRHLCMNTSTDMFVASNNAFDKYEPYHLSCFARKDIDQEYGDRDAMLATP